MSSTFQVGDIVEIKLIEKKTHLYYSKNLKKLSPFKEKLIRDIFTEIDKFKEVKQIFVFGSFLSKDVDYNDIDIMVLSDKEIEDKIYQDLIKKFSLKFHVISVEGNNLEESLKISPMTRSMFYYFVSNRPLSVPKETRIEKNHILYLLMMPEDLLKFELDSKVFYSNIRKLITIERFLDCKDADPEEINDSLRKLIREPLLSLIKNNDSIEENSIKELRKIIKLKLESIKKKL